MDCEISKENLSHDAALAVQIAENFPSISSLSRFRSSANLADGLH